MKRALNYAGVPDVVSVPGLFDDDMIVSDPAGDGIPHRKCCQDCAFADRAQIPAIMAACARKGAAFYCVHRPAETPSRVCAGYDRAARRALPPSEKGDGHG